MSELEAHDRMTEPAYDQKPELPRQVEIDWRGSEAALRHGRSQARQAGADPENCRSVVWGCLTDAARVERSLARPGPIGFVSGWPDCWSVESEIIGAYNDRLAERRSSEAKSTQFDDELYRGIQRLNPPRAAEVSRYEAVTTWLRFCHGFDKRRCIRIVWWRAHGRGYPWISQQDGLSVRRVREVRAEQLDRIVAGLSSKRLELSP